ncbi:hypothetical protein AGOR_G00171860 [Albula goreensis]|uniref:Uncharacterized protein n=1 Tax=Albula goreensis TaxID=1534307 RepID=A0A8T3CYH0_9TELE|nr:hypothetical protein AGOR_G00171860 [Albula goreensis]
MKVSGSFRFIGRVALTVGLLSLAQCRALSHTAPTPTQTGSGEAAPGGDFIRFLNAPNVVKDGHNLWVEYFCSQPCMVQVEVLASFRGKTGVAVFRRKWARQKPLAMPRTHSLVLRFPDSVAYRRDFFIRHTVDAHDVMLRAWLHHTGGPGSSEGGLHDNDSYHLALARTVMPLATKPPSLRLAKQHHTCLSWGAELMWVLTNQAKGKQCPQESSLVELLML